MSSQLTVFTAAPIISAELIQLAIAALLARDAQARAGSSLSTRLRDLVTALRAMGQRRPLSQSTSRSLDAIANRGVDLILDRAVTRPTRRHMPPLFSPIHQRMILYGCSAA
jgi:hypothetical protein